MVRSFQAITLTRTPYSFQSKRGKWLIRWLCICASALVRLSACVCVRVRVRMCDS